MTIVKIVGASSAGRPPAASRAAQSRNTICLSPKVAPPPKTNVAYSLMINHDLTQVQKGLPVRSGLALERGPREPYR